MINYYVLCICRLLVCTLFFWVTQSRLDKKEVSFREKEMCWRFKKCLFLCLQKGNLFPFHGEQGYRNRYDILIMDIKKIILRIFSKPYRLWCMKGILYWCKYSFLVGNFWFLYPLVLSKWEDLAFSVWIKVCLFFNFWMLKCTIMKNKT